MSLFRQHYHDSFNPETLVVLESVLDETWTALQNKAKQLSTKWKREPRLRTSL